MRRAQTGVLVLCVALAAYAAWLPPAATAARPFDHRHFVAAIRDASVPQQSHIDTNLFALSDANPRLSWRPGSDHRQILVVQVMSLQTFAFYTSGSGTTPASRPVAWVTLAPELRQWCRRFARRAAALHGRSRLATRIRQRLVQRLGLTPTPQSPYARVVQMWVDRDHVFRPCPDPEASDHRCDLQMQGTPQVPGIADFPSFFASLFVNAYGINGAPWTRLGYTYDWGGRRRYGASEYMLTTNTAYQVQSVSTLPGYCR